MFSVRWGQTKGFREIIWKRNVSVSTHQRDQRLHEMIEKEWGADRKRSNEEDLGRIHFINAKIRWPDDLVKEGKIKKIRNSWQLWLLFLGALAHWEVQNLWKWQTYKYLDGHLLPAVLWLWGLETQLSLQSFQQQQQKGLEKMKTNNINNNEDNNGDEGNSC